MSVYRGGLGLGLGLGLRLRGCLVDHDLIFFPETWDMGRFFWGDIFGYGYISFIGGFFTL